MTENTAKRFRLEHVGIAVKDLESAREQYARILGTAASPVEEVPSEQVRLSFFELENCRLELLEPTGPESPIQKFLDRGRSGVHHLAFTADTPHLAELSEQLKSLGVPVVGDEVKSGSSGSEVFFLHPRAASGVLIEFTRPASHEEDPDFR